MASSGKGRIIPHRGSVYVYVANDIANDSAFPFKKKEDVIVKISGQKIIVEKKSVKK